MALARTPKLLLIASLLSLAVACGVPAQEGTAALGSGGSPGGASAAVAGTLTFGSQHRFADGVTISVAAPTSFVPSAAAYPRSPRAAAFDIELDNNGVNAYKLSGLAVSANVGSAVAKQVVDTTQGYTGITDAGTDVQPGRSVHLSLAFAVPARKVQLRLQIQPDAGEPTEVTYCGPA